MGCLGWRLGLPSPGCKDCSLLDRRHGAVGVAEGWLLGLLHLHSRERGGQPL